MHTETFGWSGYDDADVGMGGLDYTPSTASVGSGAAYYPGDTSEDAKALAYLFFLSDEALAQHVGTTGTQRGDMAQNVGAWSPPFRAAVRAFQEAAGITADSWIGPNTRRALADAVRRKNASAPVPVPKFVPGVIDPPAPQPDPKTPTDEGFPWWTLGLVAVGGGAWWWRRRRARAR